MRCPVCLDHPGWAYPEETGKRRDPEDTCRACFGSGTALCANCRQPVRRMFGVLTHDRDDLVAALPHCTTGGTKVALSTS